MKLWMQMYGPPPPIPYPQYPGQYGAPPPTGPINMPPAEIKWSGLTTGGAYKIPIVAFIGRLTEMVKDFSSPHGLRIVEKYDQVQILESPVPWPWATVEFSIPYKDRDISGWGYHVESAKALGLATQAVTLDQAMAELVGKIYELRQSEQGYGEDRTTGQTMKGDVWRFVRIVTPGQAQAFPQPQYAVSQPPPPTAQPVLQPSGVPAPAVTPGMVATTPVVAPPVAPVETFNLALDPADTASVRAKKLLHGRALNEWLGVALVDEKVKADSQFINTIYDQSFIVALKASGQVVVGADGKFMVVA